MYYSNGDLFEVKQQPEHAICSCCLVVDQITMPSQKYYTHIIYLLLCAHTGEKPHTVHIESDGRSYALT
jgi:hypothetical protein